MPEDDAAQRTGEEAHRKTGKRQQRALHRVAAHREEQRAEDQRRRGAVQEEVIPFQGIPQH